MGWRTLLGFALLISTALPAQELTVDPAQAFRVSLPAGAPLDLQGADWSASKATARGGALLVDVRSTLQLRNTSARRIRAVSLLVLAQEATPGGKASVTVPSLDVAPGDAFPVRIDLRLLRPLAQAGGTLVEVGLDGVLFEDLSFFGPNRLNARRAMLAWELEARQTRRALLLTLDRQGPDSVREEFLAALASQAGQAQFAMSRVGPATNVTPSRSLSAAFLPMAGAPVEVLSGAMEVTGTELRAPRIELRNIGSKPVRFVEVAWLVEDPQGKRFAAGALPAEVALAPGGRTIIARETAFRASRAVAGLSGYVSSVEFADGELWVPPAAVLEDARRKGLVPPSGELQRLAEMYRRKGLEAVLAELRRLR
jgi:hypothetical protein